MCFSKGVHSFIVAGHTGLEKNVFFMLLPISTIYPGTSTTKTELHCHGQVGPIKRPSHNGFLANIGIADACNGVEKEGDVSVSLLSTYLLFPVCLALAHTFIFIGKELC